MLSLSKELQSRTTLLNSYLKYLKKNNILDQSLYVYENPLDDSFQVFEFYGDSVLLQKVSQLLISTRRFCSPHLLTVMRTHIVRNKNLSIVYESLNVEALISKPITDQKEKADVIEAIIGEIAMAIESKDLGDMLLKFCEKTLDNLISFIYYTGEADYFNSQILFNNEQQKLKSLQSDDEDIEKSFKKKMTFQETKVKTRDERKFIQKVVIQDKKGESSEESSEEKKEKKERRSFKRKEDEKERKEEKKRFTKHEKVDSEEEKKSDEEKKGFKRSVRFESKEEKKPDERKLKKQEKLKVDEEKLDEKVKIKKLMAKQSKKETKEFSITDLLL